MWMFGLAACGVGLSFDPAGVDGPPAVPPGTALREGEAVTVTVEGDLSACGIDGAPAAVVLNRGADNGPLQAWSARMSPSSWAAWGGPEGLDLLSMPEGSGMRTLAEAELGRPLADGGVYGVHGTFAEEGEGCRTRLVSLAVEPLVDGWYLTEVLRAAPTPREGFGCGLDRETFAAVAPCGRRVTRVHGVKAPERGGPLTPERLLAATGLARSMGHWAPNEALLVERLGPPTRIEGKQRIWAVRDGEGCVFFQVEKGWSAPIVGDRVDPEDFVGTVVEPYRTVAGAPYWEECRSASGS